MKCHHLKPLFQLFRPFYLHSDRVGWTHRYTVHSHPPNERGSKNAARLLCVLPGTTCSGCAPASQTYLLVVNSTAKGRRTLWRDWFQSQYSYLSHSWQSAQDHITCLSYRKSNPRLARCRERSNLSGSAPSTMTRILQKCSRLNANDFLHPMEDAVSPSLALSDKTLESRRCMQYLRQGVLGQLYLGKGFSSIGHVVAGSSAYCYLDRGGNKKKSGGATSWKILSCA